VVEHEVGLVERVLVQVAERVLQVQLVESVVHVHVQPRALHQRTIEFVSRIESIDVLQSVEAGLFSQKRALVEHFENAVQKQLLLLELLGLRPCVHIAAVDIVNEVELVSFLGGLGGVSSVVVAFGGRVARQVQLLVRSLVLVNLQRLFLEVTQVQSQRGGRLVRV